ncbi:MAG: UTP--glucose-1-phosphate uridylyltransferase [Candidatus Jacksonbacteria bacterium]|nr:UTP--glucose-1-phosphate uridylyltransferase [Candidatus Jacksonbacteria bacterium]
MITKAIIPVAGMGTRFLPAAKSIPKEMFPILDKPVIHYIVEEAVGSGITDIIFVTSAHKKAVEDYFDAHFELEYRLEQKGKRTINEEMRSIREMARFYFIRQPAPLGDGDAVLRARHFLKEDESCAVMWGDDIILNSSPTLKTMIAFHEKYSAPVFAVEEIDDASLERYGVIGGEPVEPNLYKVSNIIEKPKMSEAPSNLGIVGMYILTPKVMRALLSQKPAEDGEIRFSHALRDSMAETPVYAYKFPGVRFDCGNKLGWLKANAYLGLRDKEIGGELRKFMESMDG